MQYLLEKAKKIKCLICDIDGVLTDGLLYLDTQGNELRAFHVHDGVGLKLLKKVNIEVAIITTTNNAIIDKRMQQLGIHHYFKGQLNKEDAFKQLKQRLNLENEEFAYVGDDLPDLPIIKQVGLSVAVANAVFAIKQAANWQTTCHGGRGAVREVCNLILSAQKLQDLALTKYLLA